MNYEESLWSKLALAKKPVAIYGTGDGCERILSVCAEKGIKISAVFASDEFVRGQVFHSFAVTSYEAAKQRFGDMIILLAFAVFRDELYEKILSIAQENELYAPEVSLFDNELFDEKFLLENRDKIEHTRSLLADEHSCRTFDAILNFKLSGKISYLTETESSPKEAMLSLLPYSENDVYIDLGAYNGDTALGFAKMRNGRYNKIIALEPNRKSYLKMLQNCKELHDFYPLESAAWNENTHLRFRAKTGRSAAARADGQTEVCAVRADSVSDEATFIKFDVEGAEKEALEGCEGLIRTCRPALCISAYHKTGDLFNIPLQVCGMADYQIYLRRPRYIPAWDTVYFCV